MGRPPRSRGSGRLIPFLFLLYTLNFLDRVNVGFAINSMGAVGGFVGPYLIGKVKERTGDFDPGLLLLAVCLVAAVVIVLGLRARGPSGLRFGLLLPNSTW